MTLTRLGCRIAGHDTTGEIAYCERCKTLFDPNQNTQQQDTLWWRIAIAWTVLQVPLTAWWIWGR